MRKTSDITKYEISWQILRSKLKGSKVKLSDKLSLSEKFLKSNPSRYRKERVLNYLEGLALGYKGKRHVKDRHKQVIDKRLELDSVKVDYSLSDDIGCFEDYDQQDLIHLWKDLFVRNKNWLKKGYCHKEHNNFTDELYGHIKGYEVVDRQMKEIEELRGLASSMENSHSFFF